jgi:hypothetical protein
MCYVEWCDLGCKRVGLKSFVVSIDYRDLSILDAYFYTCALIIWSVLLKKPHSTIKHMHQHVCKRMLLHLMIKFSLMENFIFLCFHEHKNTELNHFNYISKLQILGCYIITCGCDFFIWVLNMPSTCGCVLAVIVHTFILFVCCRNKLVLISSDIEREERISFH